MLTLTYLQVYKDTASLILKCNPLGLTMSLDLDGSSSDTLMSIKLPDEQYRVALRLFDTDRRVEIMTKAKSTGSFEECCWIIYLDGYKDNLRRGKNVLKRLLSITEEMPADWFTYRNFMPPANQTAEEVGEEDLAPSTEPLVIHHEGAPSWVCFYKMCSLVIAR